MKPQPRQLKRWHLEKMLAQGMVMVHLDARRAGVSVPDHLAADPHLRLNLSHRFRPCDLELLDDEATVTLSFGGRPWLCRLPFDAVFGLTSHVSGESLMWFEDMPEEVVETLAREADAGQGHAPSTASAPTSSGSAPRLRAIDGQGAHIQASGQGPSTSRAAVQLHVVK